MLQFSVISSYLMPEYSHFSHICLLLLLSVISFSKGQPLQLGGGYEEPFDPTAIPFVKGMVHEDGAERDLYANDVAAAKNTAK